jgi:shikimate dehydrogenase
MKINFQNLIENNIKLENFKNFVAIIGETPSKGARSPLLWNRAFKNLSIKKKMIAIDVKKKNFSKLLLNLKKLKYFYGGSVTTPYKNLVLDYLDLIDKKAKKIGSVNTIVKIGQKLKGYNTDYYGCNYTLDIIKKKKKIKNILFLGSGGAAKACILSTIEKFKKSRIYFFNKDYDKINYYLKKINKKKNYYILKNYKDLLKINNIDLVINTTSVGFDSNVLRNNKYYNLVNYSPLSPTKKIIFFDKNSREKNHKLFFFQDNILNTIKFFCNNLETFVFDIIYNPQKTILIKIGELFNLDCLNGEKMNLMQAVYGFKLVNNYNDISKITKAMILLK